MKQSPSDASLRRDLEPSRFSAGGFLGRDPRSPEEIVAEDLRTLERAGVTLERLVEALRSAFAAGKAGLGAEVEVGQNRVAIYHESMGRIPSPFRGEGVFEKGEVTVVNRTTNDMLALTALGIHLIDRHAFFQGIGSRYRIDPLRAIAVLGLAKQ
jgi:hypothetical protein